ncbi:MAG: cupin domain-containing protein [Verrucomicrobiota bacterium]|nr:cupin domain-containing protein [Verrucomicrobiota bacterium]
MNSSYKHIPSLLNCFATQPESIVSRTLHSDAQSKVVLFGFATGQELSEHTAAVPATMHFLSGEAKVILGGEMVHAGPNTWIRMPANLPHAIIAQSNVTMLLTLFKAAGCTQPGDGADA